MLLLILDLLKKSLISRSLFKMLTVMIDAEKTEKVTMTALFKFSDTQTNLRVIIRRGVCQVSRYNTNS